MYDIVLFGCKNEDFLTICNVEEVVTKDDDTNVVQFICEGEVAAEFHRQHFSGWVQLLKTDLEELDEDKMFDVGEDGEDE